jgi:hypothetical protein
MASVELPTNSTLAVYAMIEWFYQHDYSSTGGQYPLSLVKDAGKPFPQSNMYESMSLPTNMASTNCVQSPRNTFRIPLLLRGRA